MAETEAQPRQFKSPSIQISLCPFYSEPGEQITPFLSHIASFVIFVFSKTDELYFLKVMFSDL